MARKHWIFILLTEVSNINKSVLKPHLKPKKCVVMPMADSQHMESAASCVLCIYVLKDVSIIIIICIVDV